MGRKLITILTIIILTLSMTACSDTKSELQTSIEPISKTELFMGTAVKLTIYDKNDDVGYFSVDDAVSAEEYANNILQWNDYLEIGSHEEIQLAGRTIHMYHFADKETGDAFISEGVIQLASDVVFTFTYKHMKYDESGLEEVLEALRFIVE